MRDFEGAEALIESSALKPFGQNHFFRVLNILKAERILETEVEVLELGPGALPLWTLGQSLTISRSDGRASFCKGGFRCWKSHYQHIFIKTLGSHYRADASEYK